MSIDLSRYIEVGECHEWTGPMGCGKRNHSVPMVKQRIDGKTRNLAARREVWKAAGRPIPDGYVVYAHQCCNDLCVRLEHLACKPRGAHLTRRAELGLADHMQSTRARITQSARRRPGTKYTAEQAAAVRDLASAGVRDKDISAATGVGRAMVADIRRGAAWAPVVAAGSVFGWRP